jgi:hypothetical protein
MAASEIANVKALEIALESERAPPKYPVTTVTSANKKSPHTPKPSIPVDLKTSTAFRMWPPPMHTRIQKTQAVIAPNQTSEKTEGPCSKAMTESSNAAKRRIASRVKGLTLRKLPRQRLGDFDKRSLAHIHPNCARTSRAVTFTGAVGALMYWRKLGARTPPPSCPSTATALMRQPFSRSVAT